MENETTVVNQETTDQAQETAQATEGVTSQAVVDKNVYEKVREAMKSEREAKRAAEARAAELEERIAKLEQNHSVEDDTDYDPYKAKTDILFLMNKDPFVKDNLDLIEQKMTDNPALDVSSAVREVKADFFDRINKEVSSAEPSKPLKQEKPTAIQEQIKPASSGNLLKDALEGKLENVPADQLAAIKRVMGSMK